MTTKILSLSGGGFKGLYTIRILKQLEERLGGKLSDHFRLISGTSIGGIIALAIAHGIPMSRVEEVFIAHGRKIFNTPVHVPRWYRPDLWVVFVLRFLRTLFWPIHSPVELTKVLKEMFGESTMNELTHAYAFVTATNLTTGKPQVFKTPHSEDLYADKSIKVVDAALATSAAPVYFPIHHIESNSANYADGGLIGNAPALYGWIEAKTRLEIPEENIVVLSVATINSQRTVSSSKRLKLGLLFWLTPPSLRLSEFLMGMQEEQADNMLKILNRKHPENYCYINESISQEASTDIELDKTDSAAIKTILSHADRRFREFESSRFYNIHFANQEQR